MALGDERLGKVVGPTGFGALDLDESGAHSFTGGIRFAALNLVYDVRQTLVDLFFVAGIAAEKELIHIEAIQHNLIAHGFDSANAVKGRAGILAGGTLLPTGQDIHDEQDQQTAKQQAESRVEFLSDGHCKVPPPTWAEQQWLRLPEQPLPSAPLRPSSRTHTPQPPY